MTVSYAGEVPNGSSFGCFWKILWKWRGSVYKLVWRELIAYLCLYYTINILYRFILNEQQQKIFQNIRQYFGQQSESIPMSFVLGFYVNLVVKRWWEQYRLLPWPDTLALFISAAIPNSGEGVNNETGRLMRRNIMRYMVLAYVITLQRISLRVKRRFPTTQHLVDAGLMHESEMKIFEALNAKSPMSKYWMPLVWATNIINRARRDGLIASDHIVQTILMELSDIRRRLGGLIGYDTVCVPLVYTQVVTLVLYTYFIAALLGRQMIPNLPIINGKVDHDLYFPLFTALQFAFYVGWLKVAEVLINPFGEDDDDIELNWLIDRHIKAAYMIVDEMHEEHPELLRDQYWECVVPKDLPYTVASEHYRRDEPKGSAEKYKVSKEDAMYANILPSGKRIISDDVYADYESVDTPMVERRKNNWFVRQLSRMGSMRSESTAYSSSGVHRNRLNSVYSSPESGLPLSTLAQQQQQQQNPPLQQASVGGGSGQPQITSKPTLYGKFMLRKSVRSQKNLSKQNSKFNVSTKGPPRPRYPTPENNKINMVGVSNIGGEMKNTNSKIFLTPLTAAQAIHHSHHPATITTTSTLIVAAPPPQPLTQSQSQSQTATTTISTNNDNTALYPYKSNAISQDGQVFGTLILSPIKEMDSSSSNNTLIADHSATAGLAQAAAMANANAKELELDDVRNHGSSTSQSSSARIPTFSFTGSANGVVAAMLDASNSRTNIHSLPHHNAKPSSTVFTMQELTERAANDVPGELPFTNFKDVNNAKRNKNINHSNSGRQTATTPHPTNPKRALKRQDSYPLKRDNRTDNSNTIATATSMSFITSTQNDTDSGLDNIVKSDANSGNTECGKSTIPTNVSPRSPLPKTGEVYV